MTRDPLQLWTPVADALRRTVSGETYDIWLAPLSPRDVEGDTLVVSAPDELHPWVDRRFGPVLEACAADTLPAGMALAVVPASARGDDRVNRPASLDRHPALDLNPKLTFDQFVIGDTNRFAHAAALAVAEMPGQAYNPLFLYGPPGVGKTHLLHSIANYVQAYGAGLTVRLTTAERFTNDFVLALQRGEVDAFKGAYRRNDVLLIDDVQFLESKARTEEEFFHTFNALYDAGGQLVLTSDRLPRDLDALQDRLRERFEAGLVADIRPPDRQTRLAVLRKRAHHDGIAVPDPAVLDTIADAITDNVRALEGALIRVVAFSSLTGRALTPDLAVEVIGGLYPGRRRAAHPPTIEGIQDAVCLRFGISREELVGTGRAPRVVWPRHLAMYLARERARASLPSIAAAFGGRNHTTVINAVRRANERLAADADARAAVREVAAALDDSPAP